MILTIETADAPRVDPAERVRIVPVGKTFSRMVLRFGFMETPNVPRALAIARKLGWQFDIMSTSFFLSRRSLKPSRILGCRAGRIDCLSALRVLPTMPPTISRYRQDEWLRSALRSRSRRLKKYWCARRISG